MTLVYIVELVLIGGLRRKLIDTSFYSLVEEEEMWESFDWVDTIYAITLSSLKKAIEGKLKPTEQIEVKEAIDDAMVEDKKAKVVGATYSLVGFPYAFQVMYRTPPLYYLVVKVYNYLILYDNLTIVGMDFRTNTRACC